MAQNQPSSLLYECVRESDGVTDAEVLLHCFANRLEALEVASSKYSANTNQWLLIFAGALVFIMQAGFAVSVGDCGPTKIEDRGSAMLDVAMLLMNPSQNLTMLIYHIDPSFSLLRWCARDASVRRIFKTRC